MSILYALRLAFKVSVFEIGSTLGMYSCALLAVENHFWYTGNLLVDHVFEPTKLSPDEHAVGVKDLAPIKDFSVGDPVLSVDNADGF